MWRYQVFARKLIWFFIGVYIIKIVCLLIVHSSTFHWKNQSVVNKLQTGPAETSVQKTQIWESELIFKGQHLWVAEYKCLATEKKTYFFTTKTLRKLRLF